MKNNLKSPLTSKHPHSRYLVYTSAGDAGNVAHWIDEQERYDLWITYYGNSEHPNKDSATYYNKRKGSKFQNLHHIYQTWPELLTRYEAIWVADDDIIINPAEIHQLFKIRHVYDQWICQPSFSPKGNISHPITETNPDTALRFTSFVEVTCPVFKKSCLDDFMGIYPPELVGWGIDWLFCHHFNRKERCRISIIDTISCINPTTETKNNVREINTLQTPEKRSEVWERVKSERGLDIDETHIYRYNFIKHIHTSKIMARLQMAFRNLRLNPNRFDSAS